MDLNAEECRYWRREVEECRSSGIAGRQVDHSRWGQPGVYPKPALRAWRDPPAACPASPV